MPWKFERFSWIRALLMKTSFLLEPAFCTLVTHSGGDPSNAVVTVSLSFSSGCATEEAAEQKKTHGIVD
jgi:hypothetical protein